MIEVSSPPMAKTKEGSTCGNIKVRQAPQNEAPLLYALISNNLTEGHLLPRSLEEISFHSHRFLVAVKDNEIRACAELAELGSCVTEIRSYVVSETHRHQGIGKHLLQELLTTAKEGGHQMLCAFTHNPRPFIRFGFSIVPHPWVPEKISTDCRSCSLFRNCQQYAVVLNFQSMEN